MQGEKAVTDCILPIFVTLYINFHEKNAANEAGFHLKDGCNGDLTSGETGSIGGRKVNMMCTGQQLEITLNSVKSMKFKRILAYYMQVDLFAG